MRLNLKSCLPIFASYQSRKECPFSLSDMQLAKLSTRMKFLLVLLNENFTFFANFVQRILSKREATGFLIRYLYIPGILEIRRVREIHVIHKIREKLEILDFICSPFRCSRCKHRK